MVLSTLGFVAACGGRYDVGSGEETGGAGGAGAVGGSAPAGAATAGEAGSAGAGSGGRAPTPGGAGSPAGGTAGASGAPVGGAAAGEVGCSFVPPALDEYTVAAPEVVFGRLSRFVYGELREPPEPLPAVVDADWARDTLDAMVQAEIAERGRPPEGFVAFVRDWAFGGAEESSAELWARSLSPVGHLSSFFAPTEDGRVSIMSDVSFSTAHPNSTRRGIWMLRELFCTELPLPPPDVELEPLEPMPGMTRRQTVEAAVADPACVGCHVMFDPLGFSLEHYDALGNYRTAENGLPIDASGMYAGPHEEITFSSIDDLASKLLGLCEVQSCFARRFFENALERAYDGNPPSPSEADVQYVVSELGFHYLGMGAMLRGVVTAPAFLRE